MLSKNIYIEELILQETCTLIKNAINTIAGTENVPEEIRKIIG